MAWPGREPSWCQQVFPYVDHVVGLGPRVRGGWFLDVRAARVGRAVVRLDVHQDRGQVRGLIEVGREVDRVEEGRPLDGRQDRERPRPPGCVLPADGQRAEGVVVILHGEPELLQVVHALGPPRRLARRLHCRQEQRDQDGDDGDHHQKFDQGEGATFPHHQGDPQDENEKDESGRVQWATHPHPLGLHPRPPAPGQTRVGRDRLPGRNATFDGPHRSEEVASLEVRRWEWGAYRIIIGSASRCKNFPMIHPFRLRAGRHLIPRCGMVSLKKQFRGIARAIGQPTCPALESLSCL